MKPILNCTVAVILGVLALVSARPAQSQEGIFLAKGQTIYVPTYSHIYAGNREMPILLTVTLSIRNPNPFHPVRIDSAVYYGSKGERIREFLDKPIDLGPLESTRYVIPQRDKSGGSGASFLVVWSSKTEVNPPIAETVMIATEGQNGISFTSRGQAIAVNQE